MTTPETQARTPEMAAANPLTLARTELRACAHDLDLTPPGRNKVTRALNALTALVACLCAPETAFQECAVYHTRLREALYYASVVELKDGGVYHLAHARTLEQRLWTATLSELQTWAGALDLRPTGIPTPGVPMLPAPALTWERPPTRTNGGGYYLGTILVGGARHHASFYPLTHTRQFHTGSGDDGSEVWTVPAACADEVNALQLLCGFERPATVTLNGQEYICAITPYDD